MEQIKKFDIQNSKFHVEYSIVEQRMLNIEQITDNKKSLRPSDLVAINNE